MTQLTLLKLHTAQEHAAIHQGVCKHTPCMYFILTSKLEYLRGRGNVTLAIHKHCFRNTECNHVMLCNSVHTNMTMYKHL